MIIAEEPKSRMLEPFEEIKMRCQFGEFFVQSLIWFRSLQERFRMVHAQLLSCRARLVQKLTTIKAPLILDRMCRLLTSHSGLICSIKEPHNGVNERFYGLATVCKFLIKNKTDVSFAPFLLINHDKILMDI